MYPVVYSPRYVKEEKKVRIETSVMLFLRTKESSPGLASLDTFNPSKIKKAIDRQVKLRGGADGE